MANQRRSLTPQITTGNVRTTVDSTQQNELGTEWTDPSTGATYRYAQVVITAAPAIQSAPAAVWWVDANHTQITATLSEAYDATASSAAGILMPNSTDISGLTTAKLKNNYVWVCIGGPVTGVASAAAAAGDKLMATQADWTTTGGFSKVTATAAATSKVVGYAKAASASDVIVCIGSY